MNINRAGVIVEDRTGTGLLDLLPSEETRETYRRNSYIDKPGIEVLGINQLKLHRSRAGLSLSVVARVTGQHMTTVARHETRTKKIPVCILEMYSQIYGTDIKRLMLRDDTI